MIRLSYVMPVFNRPQCLATAAESVLRQLEPGDELIVVDDGSTDDTPSRLSALGERWSKLLRVERQANAGPGAARNRGIELAAGDWIGFLDSDDELLPGAVKLVREAIARRPDAGFLCGGRLEKVNGGAERRLPGRPVPADPRRAMESFLVTSRRSLGVGAVLARRDVARRTGFPAELPFAEDNVFFARALGSTPTISLAEPLYRYHLEPARVIARAHWRDFSVERMVDLMFDPAIVLPQVQALKPRALAAAWLSVFRDLHRLGRDREARAFYRRAFVQAPALALRWRYLRKLLRGLIGMRHRESRRAARV
jgi:glycosyltransferase involved in cell wall biosynthesis